MKIDKFINDYNLLTKEDLKLQFIEEVIKTEYVPYKEKVKLAKQCIKENYISDYEVECNTTATYIAFILSVLKLFTTLEVDGQDMYFIYDQLQQYGLIDEIISILQEKSIINEYDVIYKMCQYDFEKNCLSPRGFIQNQVKKFGQLCNDSFSKLADAIKQLDPQELEKIFKK